MRGKWYPFQEATVGAGFACESKVLCIMAIFQESASATSNFGELRNWRGSLVRNLAEGWVRWSMPRIQRVGVGSQAAQISRTSSHWTLEGMPAVRQKPAFLRNLWNQFPSANRSHFFYPWQKWHTVPSTYCWGCVYQSPFQPPGSLSPYSQIFAMHFKDPAPSLGPSHLRILCPPRYPFALFIGQGLPPLPVPFPLFSQITPAISVNFLFSLLWTLPGASEYFFLFYLQYKPSL